MNKIKKLFFANILAGAGWTGFLFWSFFFYNFTHITSQEMQKIDPSGIGDISIMNYLLTTFLIIFCVFILLLSEIVIKKFVFKNTFDDPKSTNTKNVFNIIYSIYIFIGLLLSALIIITPILIIVLNSYINR